VYRIEVIRFLTRHYPISDDMALWRAHIEICEYFNMTPDEAKSHILHYLSDKTNNKQLLEYEYPYEFLNAKLSECTKEVINKNKTDYVNKGGEWVFELNLGNKCFWVRYTLVWKVFENRYTPKYYDIQGIIKTWLYDAFKLRDVTPYFPNGDSIF